MSTPKSPTTHKYSTDTTSAQSATWRWQHVHGHPRLSDHAIERYDQRTAPESVSPERAWRNGIDAGLVTSYFDGTRPAAEVRWHPETDAVFISVGDVVVTTLVLRRVDDGAVRAYLHARAQAERDGR